MRLAVIFGTLFCFSTTLHIWTNASPMAYMDNASPRVVASFSEPIYETLINRTGVANSTLPLFYGWFFNESVAESISIIGKKYFLSAYDNIPKFQQFINQLMVKSNVTNPLEFYVKPLDPDSGLPDLKYHTTAKFCGRNESSVTTAECKIYLEEIGQYLGRPYRIHFVGLFFTENTYGIRVKLTGEEQKLFREDTRVNTAQQSVTDEELLDVDTFSPALSTSEEGSRHPRHFPYEPYYYIHPSMDSGNTPFYPGIQFVAQKQNFHPTESRAHVTLGCAPEVQAVQTGLDLLNIIDLEVSSFAQHRDYNVGGNDIPKGILREILIQTEGNYTPTAFVVYPEDEMIADAVFDAYL